MYFMLINLTFYFKSFFNKAFNSFKCRFFDIIDQISKIVKIFLCKFTFMKRNLIRKLFSLINKKIVKIDKFIVHLSNSETYHFYLTIDNLKFVIYFICYCDYNLLKLFYKSIRWF